jgi:hypothetical protein
MFLQIIEFDISRLQVSRQPFAILSGPDAVSLAVRRRISPQTRPHSAFRLQSTDRGFRIVGNPPVMSDIERLPLEGSVQIRSLDRHKRPVKGFQEIPDEVRRISKRRTSTGPSSCAVP